MIFGNLHSYTDSWTLEVYSYTGTFLGLSSGSYASMFVYDVSLDSFADHVSLKIFVPVAYELGRKCNPCE